MNEAVPDSQIVVNGVAIPKCLYAGTPVEVPNPVYVQYLEQKLAEAKESITRLQKRVMDYQLQQEAQVHRATRQWQDQADYLDYPDDNYDR